MTITQMKVASQATSTIRIKIGVICFQLLFTAWELLMYTQPQATGEDGKKYRDIYFTSKLWVETLSTGFSFLVLVIAGKIGHLLILYAGIAVILASLFSLVILTCPIQFFYISLIGIGIPTNFLYVLIFHQLWQALNKTGEGYGIWTGIVAFLYRGTFYFYELAFNRTTGPGDKTYHNYLALLLTLSFIAALLGLHLFRQELMAQKDDYYLHDEEENLELSPAAQSIKPTLYIGLNSRFFQVIVFPVFTLVLVLSQFSVYYILLFGKKMGWTPPERQSCGQFLKISAMCWAVGALLGGVLLDKCRFKSTMASLLTLQTLVSISLIIAINPPIFYVTYLLGYLLAGVFFSYLMAALPRAFGFNTGAYLAILLLVVFRGLPLAHYEFNQRFYSHQNLELVTKIPVVCSLVALLLVAFVRDKILW